MIASVIGSSSIQPSTLAPSKMAASTMPASKTETSMTEASSTEASSTAASTTAASATAASATEASSTATSGKTDASRTDASRTDASNTAPSSASSSGAHRPDGSLEEIRADIERVDQTIIRAIAERMELARAVGRVKALTGQPVTDPAREASVVARAAALAREAGLPEDEIRALYWRLIAFSRRAQLDG